MKYLHEDMNKFTLSLELIHPLLLQALVPTRKKDLIILIPIPNERKKSKNWKNEFSWLVYDEDINGALQSLLTDHSR